MLYQGRAGLNGWEEKMSRTSRRISRAQVVAFLLLFAASCQIAHAQVIRKYIVMRVDFQNSTTAPLCSHRFRTTR